MKKTKKKKNEKTACKNCKSIGIIFLSLKKNHRNEKKNCSSKKKHCNFIFQFFFSFFGETFGIFFCQNKTREIGKLIEN